MMSKIKYCWFSGICFTSIVLSLAAAPVYSAINLNGTRYIYGQNDSEVTVQVHNVGNNPVLLQNWIDDGHTDVLPEKVHVPFVITPPLSRLEGMHGQTLRITYTGDALPKDKESVFWLNVLEIPPLDKSAKNQLNVAFRNRVKLFWRPATLKEGVDDAPKQLTWHANGDVLDLDNPTPYFISLTGIKLNYDGHSTVVPGKMIAPSEIQHYSFSQLTKNKTPSDMSVEIVYINDYGTQIVQKIDNK